MASFPSIGPNVVLSPFPHRTRTTNPLFHRTHFVGLSNHKPLARGTLGVARFGFNHMPFLDQDGSEGLIRELFGRAENLLFTIADAAVSSSDAVTTTKQNNDWLSGISNYMESVLKILKDGLSTVHVPYAYGFAIILLTVLVKAATFPLTKKQVESAMSMRSLQPQIKAIQQRYAGDQERIQLETARLYKLAGINPLAGCLPTLATIPVWIGLYRALSNVADEGLLTEGFFWIPSLAGPTTIAARQNGSGISWLFPFVDGHPPLGWPDTFAYLVLPVLLVFSQYVSVQIMQSSQANDPNMKTSQAITRFLPLMIGYFALSVPSGLSLYWLTNNILSTAQQVWLQKMGGAKTPVGQFNGSLTKEEEPQIQKSILETSATTIEKPREAEKSTPEGPRPGERFKQLKEQEAMRKRQREEENRKVEATSVKNNDGSEAESPNARSGSSNSASGIGERVVNGDVTSTSSSKEDQKDSTFMMENAEVKPTVGNDGVHLHDSLEKEESTVATGTADDKRFGEDAAGHN